ncbi:MAG: hypothetical protein OEY80_03825 [Nitrospirota bacterium]|jgi:hypothetical protein|nr:hypothetical protein [Nitrospirota bacterium]MDH4360689.1 hypothetical protein [Nitrospirota bacterium]MDH5574592.1 hypothetical protein [Nitrospirota bacterium]
MMPSLSRRTSLVLGLALVTVASALFLEYFLSVRADRPFGHTQVAHLVGWMGLVFIGFTFVYPVKRWMDPNQVWSQRWFQAHIVFGIVGPLVIFVHAGVHFHAWVPILALIAMVLVVMSGITGQALHYLAFRTLYERRHESAFEGMTEEAIDAHLHDLALQEETLRWWKCLHGPLTWAFVSLTLLHIGGVLYFGGF